MTETTKAPAKAAEPAVQAPAAPAEGNVIARVLPKGDGEIFTGEQRGTEFPRYAKGDKPELPLAVAQALEDRGFVEIL